MAKLVLEAKKKIKWKPDWAIEKHRTALAGTAFEKKCAECPGTLGKIVIQGEKKLMGCSNGGATPVLVTEKDARECIDRKPLPSNRIETSTHHKPHPIFRKPNNHP